MVTSTRESSWTKRERRCTLCSIRWRMCGVTCICLPLIMICIVRLHFPVFSNYDVNERRMQNPKVIGTPSLYHLFREQDRRESPIVQHASRKQVGAKRRKIFLQMKNVLYTAPLLG